MSYLALSLTFNALYLIIALVQVGHCLHLLRLSTPLKSTNYLLLVGSLCYVVTRSTSIPVDVVFEKLESVAPGELFWGVVDFGVIQQTVALDFAGAALSSVGFALVSISILYAIAAAGKGNGKALFWVGVGSAAIPAMLDIARFSNPYWFELDSRDRRRNAAIILGLRIAAIPFHGAFLAVLGKVGTPYTGHSVSHVPLSSIHIPLIT